METTLQYSNSKTARLAAAQFFFVGVPLSLWGQAYVLGKIIVPQDPVATATNLLSNEFLFRMSIFSHLVDTIFFVLSVLLFSRIFHSVDKFLSRLMVFSVLAQMAMVFVFEVINFAALMILKSDTRLTFDVAQQQEAAYFLLRLHGYGVGVGMGKLFAGLCFIPFGMLVFKSGHTPRIIGVLIIICGVGYLGDCCASILLQRADYLIVGKFLRSPILGYLLAQLWFLIKGVRETSVTVNS